MRIAATIMCVVLSAGALLLAQAPAVPRTWDEHELQEWATPVAGLDARPGHFSQAEYERAPVDNLRTYPVYYPGREPAGSQTASGLRTGSVGTRAGRPSSRG